MQVGHQKIKEEIITQLVMDIRKKKELSSVDEDFIKNDLKKYFLKNPKKIIFLSEKFSLKSKNYKQIIKEVRSNLRRVHGLFKEAGKRDELFKELLKTKPTQKQFLELHKKILETHYSSKERLEFYPRLYKKLFQITGTPNSILDLGSGINPFSVPFMDVKKLTYFAYDISFDEIDLLNNYFKFMSRFNISGKAKILNLAEWQKISKLKKVDLCFLWKMTDVLDRGRGHKVSELVISNLPAKFIVVSFPTVTVGGKLMNQPRRRWMELMCQRLGFSYKIITEENEIFYVVSK